MNTRLKELRKTLGKSQEEFGKLLGLSKSGVSDIESGRRNVTEQHIIMLKNYTDNKYGSVNEAWLRTGEGEMFLPKTREEDIAKLTLDLLADEPESFKNRLISALAKLSVEEWEVLEKIFTETVGK